jgi:hypothetical protein
MLSDIRLVNLTQVVYEIISVSPNPSTVMEFLGVFRVFIPWSAPSLQGGGRLEGCLGRRRACQCTLGRLDPSSPPTRCRDYLFAVNQEACAETSWCRFFKTWKPEKDRTCCETHRPKWPPILVWKFNLQRTEVETLLAEYREVFVYASPALNP